MINKISLNDGNLIIYKEEILDKLSLGKSDIVYLSGSLIEGVGNELSDIDVFVLVDDLTTMNTNVQFDLENVKIKIDKLDCGTSIDIEYWRKDVLIEMIEDINKYDGDSVDITELYKSASKSGIDIEDFISFIHRFLNCVPIYNEDEFTNLRNMLNFKNFNKFAVRYYIGVADNQYVDVNGNLNSKKLESALICTNDLLLNAMFAYIFSWNATVDRKKWVFEKMKILATDNKEVKYYCEKFSDLLFNISVNSDEYAIIYCEKVLDFFNEVVDSIQTRLGGI